MEAVLDEPVPLDIPQNEVASLDSIDIALSSINRKVRTNGQDLEGQRELRGEYQEQLGDYKGLEELDGFITGLEQKENHIRLLKRKSKELASIIESIKERRISVKETEKILSVKEKVKALSKMADEIGVLKDKSEDLQSLIDRIEETEGSIRSWGKSQIALRHKFKQLMPDVCPLCEQEIR